MGKRYVGFTKGQFEYNVRNFLINNRLGFMEDITDKWLKAGGDTWERIYTISTKNKAVTLVVFSSVDMRTDKVREKDSDCVRIVMRWKTKNGYRWSRVAKHYRLATLFKNMQESIEKAQDSVFALNGAEFRENWYEVA